MASSGPSLPPQRSMHSQEAALVDVFVGESFHAVGGGAEQSALGEGPIGRRRGLVEHDHGLGAGDSGGEGEQQGVAHYRDSMAEKPPAAQLTPPLRRSKLPT